MFNLKTAVTGVGKAANADGLHMRAGLVTEGSAICRSIAARAGPRKGGAAVDSWAATSYTPAISEGGGKPAKPTSEPKWSRSGLMLTRSSVAPPPRFPRYGNVAVILRCTTCGAVRGPRRSLCMTQSTEFETAWGPPRAPCELRRG